MSEQDIIHDSSECAKWQAASAIWFGSKQEESKPQQQTSNDSSEQADRGSVWSASAAIWFGRR